ncbi:helix-turn-helix domain-containing protein [Piscinibacter terrae]|uniref:Helix-turn-helix domain-containing protein n=1 Tax=Piscinibacter terrae TaxID=2496871 RepID=A0A3N7HRQ8_9BURK|nr:helix-turn-helix domain-containing protein [Albitalea terrae]RQP23481.1 helix-turn-helix domain-containing protein [Albitalea terrae]
MPLARTRPVATALPTYALYGEQGRSLGVDWLHIESIAARSRLHDWEIKPHRHDLLFQILYIRSGQVKVSAEGDAWQLRGPCAMTVPALSAHGFAFSRKVDGLVITVLEQHLRDLLAHEQALLAQTLRLRAQALPREAADAIGSAVMALRDEFTAAEPWRGLAIDTALLHLVVLVQRALGQGERNVDDGDRAFEHVRRFRTLVEARFREQVRLSDCASELGITPTQLNRVCHRVLGQSALAVMNARIVLEAQRELAYTTMSVKQIGLGLGFADPAYFTRFFLRETGQSPTTWRQAAQSMRHPSA